MPAVPKPGQATKKTAAKKKPAAKKKKTPAEGTHKANGSAPALPKKGKCAAWLEEIREQGGVTKQEIIDGCVPHGLKASMRKSMTSYCDRLGLLKAPS
jgi:hypothetical protein